IPPAAPAPLSLGSSSFTRCPGPSSSSTPPPRYESERVRFPRVDALVESVAVEDEPAAVDDDPAAELALLVPELMFEDEDAAAPALGTDPEAGALEK
ncbi:uncharacterized protein FOMMEDRAFT_22520, partial [Fomitiporia mediterranea MF3/22]|uniref:uncharacterized protein n=1 Tax=Fomitiporia mediterranea (strain MF3/22) TaxID=694068 RepID=UPI000440755F